MPTTNTDVTEIISDQMKRQGVGCIRVTDGYVFTFDVATLTKMIDRARTNPREQVVVFVKKGPEA